VEEEKWLPADEIHMDNKINNHLEGVEWWWWWRKLLLVC